MEIGQTNSKSFNSKMNKMSKYVVLAYLITYTHFIIMTFVIYFINSISVYVRVILEISYCFYHVNNVNPFIYYVTLKGFREGYQNLPRCRMVKEITTTKYTYQRNRLYAAETQV